MRAALLTGSAARGDADRHSDVDLLLYVDERPDEPILRALATAAGAGRVVPKPEARDVWIGVDAYVDGVRVEVSFATVRWVESKLRELLDERGAVGTPFQKALAGFAEGMALHDDGVLANWQERVRVYPEPMRRAMVEHHWRFFPLWQQADKLAARDAELWRLDILLDAAFDLLGVLAGLNGVYFARFELKRTRDFAAKLERKPPRLVDRLEGLFRAEPAAAARDLRELVDETRALVLAAFPDLDLSAD